MFTKESPDNDESGNTNSFGPVFNWTMTYRAEDSFQLVDGLNFLWMNKFLANKKLCEARAGGRKDLNAEFTHFLNNFMTLFPVYYSNKGSKFYRTGTYLSDRFCKQFPERSPCLPGQQPAGKLQNNCGTLRNHFTKSLSQVTDRPSTNLPNGIISVVQEGQRHLDPLRKSGSKKKCDTTTGFLDEGV